ncbi:MAG TPA: sigma-70 family RNA polymerase sigma factor [Bryobacteraceae bacterium]|nr:sigma-70 family RNA polymerase sigma factor [Bryobacteraceae bacterium]
MAADTAEITKLLCEVRAGDHNAAEQLMDAVYTDLRAMAHRIFSGERSDHTLQPTALVHEVWLRIFSGADVPWNDRVHFYAVAARQMRRLLADHGREFRALKRGAGLKVSLDEKLHGSPLNDCQFDDLNRLLDVLQRKDPEAFRVVEMKFFSGMTDEEVAAEMGCSHSSVRRHWNFAKAWLVRQMTDSVGEKN